MQTFREQQRLKDRGPYKFQRSSAVPPIRCRTAATAIRRRPCGLIHSGFRPSDDACIFPFLIPSNFFAVTALEQLQEIHGTELKNPAFAGSAAISPPKCGRRWRGTARRRIRNAARSTPTRSMATAARCSWTTPGCLACWRCLTSAAWRLTDPVYRNTRAFSLSDDNPFFYRGTAAEGLGGPHAGLGMIWPLGIIVRALTSTDEKEIAACLATLKATHAGTGFMHESFDRNDAKRFTRKWFAWANTLFGELILTVAEKYPLLLRG